LKFSGKQAFAGRRFSYSNNFFDYTTVALYPANFISIQDSILNSVIIVKL
jgi:hypothetical protein